MRNRWFHDLSIYFPKTISNRLWKMIMSPIMWSTRFVGAKQADEPPAYFVFLTSFLLKNVYREVYWTKFSVKKYFSFFRIFFFVLVLFTFVFLLLSLRKIIFRKMMNENLQTIRFWPIFFYFHSFPFWKFRFEGHFRS